MTQLQTVSANSGSITQINEIVRSLAPAGLYGIDPATTAGLTLGFYGGQFNGVTVADGTVSLTASNTNYVVAHRTTGVVTAAITTTNWLDTTTYLQLYQLVAGGSTFTIAATSDKRQAFGGSGTSSGMSNPMTTVGDIIYGGTPSAGVAPPTRLAATTDGHVLTLAAGLPAWAAPTSGFTNPMTTIGDLIVGGTSGAAGRLAAGTLAFVLTSNGPGNAPSWQAAPGGGSGTVTSVDASGGVETASGAAITATGTVRGAVATNPQTGGTYTYVTGDRGKLVTHTNATSVAATLPQATGTFPANWYMWVKNKGAGTVTITPTTSTIDGAASLALTTGQWALIISDGTNYQALTYAPATGGGGLTNFTDALNSSAPNATVPVASLTATNGATNVDVVLEAKGTGATSAQVSLSTTASGNKRGTYATDWQKTRTAASQVASGTGSVIAGGSGNTSSGTQTVVGGGSGNNASNSQSTIAGGFSGTASAPGASVGGGQSNTASGTNATVAGGNTNTASTDSTTVAGGASNTASATASTVTGGSNNTADGAYSRAGGLASSTRGVQGADVYSSYNGGSAGLAQGGTYHLIANTTDATATAMTAMGSAAAASNQVKLVANSSFGFDGLVVARKSGSADYKVWSVVGALSQVANNAATSLDAGATPTVVYESAGATTWSLVLSADTTNGCLRLTFTGQAATTIRVMATIRTSEVVRS